MSTQEFFAFKITKYLNDQLESANSYEVESKDIGKTPDIVTSRTVTQNPDGTWSNNPKELVKPIKTPLELKKKELEEQEKTVDDYKNLIKPYDDQMLAYNDDVNNVKQQIINIVNSAVSYGCSTAPSYNPQYDLTTGFAIIPKKLPPLIINGVTVGIASAITEDLVKIKRYENLEEMRDNKIFEESKSRLTQSNLGKGFENTLENNDGNSLGEYRIISPYTVGLFGIIQSSLTCAGYASSVNQLATEISRIRKLRSNYLSVVNQLKEDKIQEEITMWGNKDVKNAIRDRKRKLQTSIKNISNFVDPIVMDQLVIYSDADKSYGITTSIENTTGINQVISLANLASDGVYATAPEESPTYDSSDGGSIWFNQYGTTKKYLEFDKSYIDGDGSGISSGDVSYTLESWFKITDDSTLTSNIDTGGASIVGISSTKGIGLQVYKPSGIRINSGSRQTGSLENTFDLSLNRWYHVAFVREVGKDNKLYIDGVLNNTSDISNLNVISSNSRMRVGFCTSSYIRQYFPGKISAVRFYSKALTNVEVKQNYEAHVSRFADTV